MLTLDGTGWHQLSDCLMVPDNIGLLLLPPYSPELDPAESVWEVLRRNDLSTRFHTTNEAILDAVVSPGTN